MEEVRKVFKEEVEQFKKDLKRRTHALREKVQDFQTLLMVETKMRPVVASLVVAKIWSECSEASISQPIRDVAQAMCRSDLHGWKKLLGQIFVKSIRRSQIMRSKRLLEIVITVSTQFLGKLTKETVLSRLSIKEGMIKHIVVIAVCTSLTATKSAM